MVTARNWLAHACYAPAVAILFCTFSPNVLAEVRNELLKLLPSDGAPGDEFGISVGISGITAIVGAWGVDDDAIDRGAAYLFDITTGTQTAKLAPSDRDTDDSFGNSVGISGNTAIVGAYGGNNSGINSGESYVFDITTPWQFANLIPDDGAAGDLFGYSVAIGGSTAIVGARHGGDYETQSGSAYLFSTATGSQIAKLLPNEGTTDDRFGSSVAITGITAIVGARWNDDNGSASGSAYVFAAREPGTIALALFGAMFGLVRKRWGKQGEQ